MEFNSGFKGLIPTTEFVKSIPVTLPLYIFLWKANTAQKQQIFKLQLYELNAIIIISTITESRNPDTLMCCFRYSSYEAGRIKASVYLLTNTHCLSLSLNEMRTHKPLRRIWHSEYRASWCILIMKANETHYFSDLFDKVLYMFRRGPLPIIRSI